MTIQRLLDALVDGRRIDWDEAERQAPDDDSRRTIRELRVVAGIHSAHQGGAGRTHGSVAVPFQWGPLQVRAFLARGAHGDVYRAWDARLERHVALKLLHHDAPSDPAERGPIAEGRLLARVRQENVVTVYGADRIDGRAGVWMELVDGLTIREQVDAHGPLATEVAAAVACAVLSGLGAIHRAGLIHRDIKAQNVVQADGGRTILMDLGAGLERGADDNRVEGTPVYLAPELLTGAAATIASDIYAAGVLLFYMVTGSYPVDGQSLDELRQRHESKARPTRPANVPRRLAQVIERALSVNPRDRFASALEMKAAIETATRPHPRPSMFAAAGALLAVATLASVTAVKWQRPAATGIPLRAHDAVLVPAPENQTSNPPLERQERAEPPAAPPAALKFEGRDSALITAFDNRTDEPILDNTLELALARELSNSPFVDVVPRERVDDVLHLMLKPVDTTIDAQVGREICLRDGRIRALITGRVEKIGARFVLTSQIVNPRDGSVVTSITENADSLADLLPAVRREGLKLRESLGEMRSTIRMSEAALEKVTTPSLQALQLYSRASAFMHGDTWDNAAAEQLLRQAVAEDDRFASAYILLAFTINNQQRPSVEYMPLASKALQLSTQTNDAERYFITGGYYGLAARSGGSNEERDANRRKAIAAYRSLLQISPGHYWGAYNLFGEYDRMRQEPEATNALIHAAEVRSSSVSLRLQVALRLLERGDVEALHRSVRQLEQLLPKDTTRLSPSDAAAVRLLQADEAWITYDVTPVRRLADEVLRNTSENSDLTRVSLPALAHIYAGLGRTEDYRRAIVPLMPPAVRDRQVVASLIGEIDLGKTSAMDLLDDLLAVKLRDPVNVPFNSLMALGLVKVGRIEDARIYVEPLTGSLDDAVLQASILCAEGRVPDCLQWFNAARERGFGGIYSELREGWAVADGWRRAGQPQSAIVALEAALKNRWPAVVLVPFGVVNWIQDRALLADLYRETGREKEAAAIDRELSKLLAEADADHPVLMRLKARYGQSALP